MLHVPGRNKLDGWVAFIWAVWSYRERSTNPSRNHSNYWLDLTASGRLVRVRSRKSCRGSRRTFTLLPKHMQIPAGDARENYARCSPCQIKNLVTLNISIITQNNINGFIGVLSSLDRCLTLQQTTSTNLSTRISAME